MINLTSDFLLLKANVKDFEKALSDGNIVKLQNIANILVMNTDLLLLETMRHVNKS